MEPGTKRVGRFEIPRVPGWAARLLWLLTYLRSRLLAMFDPREAQIRKLIDGARR